MKSFLCVILSGLSVPLPLAARDAASDSVGGGLQDLEKRVSVLEEARRYLPKVSGFINLRYRYDWEDDTNGFDIRRARLDFKGGLSDKLDYRLQVEFANSVKIIDAYFRYKIAGNLNVQAGEFKIPLSLESFQYGPTSLEVIDNSLVVSRLCNYSDVSGIKANGRDVGVSLNGSLFRRKGYSLLDYSFGLFNGNGINVNDNNKSKDFSGMLIFNPVKQLSVAGYYYNGSYGDEGGGHSRERVGGGLKWTDSRLLVRSEYIYGRTGGTESEGVYAVAAYKVIPGLQLLLKYDYFQEDKSAGDSRERDYTLGLNYFPLKNVRLQANYVYKSVSSSGNHSYAALQTFVQF